MPPILVTNAPPERELDVKELWLTSSFSKEFKWTIGST